MNKWSSDDIINYNSYSSAIYSNDSDKILFLDNKVSSQTQFKSSNICLMDIKSKNVRILKNSNEQFCYINPTFKENSADEILYLSNESGIYQLYYENLKTGENKKLTNSKFDIKEYLYSDRNKSYICVTDISKNVFDKSSYARKRCVWSDLYLENTKKDDVFVSDKLDYITDDKGFINFDYIEAIICIDIQKNDIYIIDRVRKAYGFNKSMSLSPNQNILLYESLIKYEEAGNFSSKIYVWNFETKERESLCDWKNGTQSEAIFSPNSRYVAFVGNQNSYHTSQQVVIYFYDCIKKQIINSDNIVNQDFQAVDYMVCDSKMNISQSSIKWDENSISVYSLISSSGAVKLYRFYLDGRIEKVFDEYLHILEFDISKTYEKAVLNIKSSKIISQLVQIDLNNACSELLLESKLDRQMADYIKLEYEGDDFPLVGTLALPENIDLSKKYKMIVNIHGGPYTMHGNTFYHEIQMMCSEEYIVLLPNPRGSFGYGQNHLDGVVGKYGQGDYLDILDLLDKVLIEFDFIDRDKIYVTGGSYGGFMTNWLITKTDIFKAAVTQRSICNYISMWGTSDIGYHFYREDLGEDIINADKLWEHSPLAYVENVKTPCKILHSLNDYRCPVSQAQEWFTALKYLNIDTELVLFPNSNHGLSRGGKFCYRKRRLDEIMLWFDKYR